MSAPRDSSSLTTSTRSAAAANINAVWPLASSFTFGSAPFSSSMRTASALPACEACINAVAPVVVAAATGAPAAISGAITDGVADLRGEVERRVAADARLRAEVGAGVQQHRGQLRVAVEGGPVQRGHAVALGGVDVNAFLEQLPHGGHVFRCGRVRDRRRRRGVK